MKPIGGKINGKKPFQETTSSAAEAKRAQEVDTSRTGQEVYPSCLRPEGCVFCGGECPYIQSKPLDDQVLVGYPYQGPRGETN
jgi:hypothetical protein